MKFLTHYQHNGSEWSLIIDAENWPDAEARCAKLNLTLGGEYIATVPYRAGWLVKFLCAVRNWIWINKAD